jgi:hypothetical protein
MNVVCLTVSTPESPRLVHVGDENVPPPIITDLLPPPLLRQETIGPEEFGQFQTTSEDMVVINGEMEDSNLSQWQNFRMDFQWNEEEEDSGDEYEKEDIPTDSDSESESGDDMCVVPMID